MAKIRLCWNNLWNAAAAVATASGSATALPPENSQTTDRTMVWRSTTGTGTQQLQVDLGSAQAITAVALANVKLLSGGSVTLEQAGSGGSPGAWSAVGSALPAADIDTKVTFAFFGSVSARWWRLNFSNPGGVSDYAEVGYVHLGGYFEPATNIVVPFEVPLTPNSTLTKSLTGQRSTTLRPQQSRGRFAWELLLDTDLATLQQIFRTLDLGTPMFVVLDTAIAWTAWLLYFTGAIGRGFPIVGGRYDTGFDWEEAL